MYSFNIGGSGVILSKKIIANILITLLVLAVVVVKARDRYAGHVYIDTTWPEFEKQCSRTAMESHSVAIQCHLNYEGKTVRNWRGYVLRLKDNRSNLYRFLEYHVCMYVKLEPRLNDEDIDALLTLDSFTVAEYEDMLDGMHHGDELIFNATFFSVAGGRGSDAPRHLHITNMNTTGRKNPSLPYYLLKTERQGGNLQKQLP